MLLEIIDTTDGRHIGKIIDSEILPIELNNDTQFAPDRIWQTDGNTWRLANSNYIIDSKEI